MFQITIPIYYPQCQLPTHVLSSIIGGHCRRYEAKPSHILYVIRLRVNTANFAKNSNTVVIDVGDLSINDTIE